MSNPVHKYDAHIEGGPTQLTTINSDATNQFFGSTLLNTWTGVGQVAVSAPMVNSDSIFRTSLRMVGIGPAQAAGVLSVGVTSVVAGVGFILRSTGSSASTSVYVDWQFSHR